MKSNLWSLFIRQSLLSQWYQFYSFHKTNEDLKYEYLFTMFPQNSEIYILVINAGSSLTNMRFCYKFILTKVGDFGTYTPLSWAHLHLTQPILSISASRMSIVVFYTGFYYLFKKTWFWKVKCLLCETSSLLTLSTSQKHQFSTVWDLQCPYVATHNCFLSLKFIM